MTPSEWERRLKVAEAAAKKRPRAMLIINDPEDNLAEYRLPDWVADALGTIEIGRPGGPDTPAESTAEWIERLTRDALKAQGELDGPTQPEAGND
jgi:hypothetical protein